MLVAILTIAKKNLPETHTQVLKVGGRIERLRIVTKLELR